MASGLMDMPPELREAGSPPTLDEGSINMGPGLEAGWNKLEEVRQAWINQGEKWKAQTQEMQAGMGMVPEKDLGLSMDTSNLPAGGGRAGAAKLAIGLMTKPEWFRNVYSGLEKQYGKVSPETAAKLRAFIDQYPAEILDKLKWWKEVPKEAEKVAMPEVLGRYWNRDVRRSMNVGKWPKSTHGTEASPEEIAKLKEITAGTEGAGYLTRGVPSYWRKAKAVQEWLDVHFHETLHHLESELRQKFDEKEVLEAGRQLAKGEVSPYFNKLMGIWDQVKDRYR